MFVPCPFSLKTRREPPCSWITRWAMTRFGTILRIIFNRPLAATQSVQMRLAEMARQITLAQLMSLQLGRLKDAGKMQPTQVSMAKWNNCRMAIEIARDARDLLGGAGITTEYCPIRHMNNLESVITYEGTHDIHLLITGNDITGLNAFN